MSIKTAILIENDVDSYVFQINPPLKWVHVEELLSFSVLISIHRYEYIPRSGSLIAISTT